MTRALTFVCVAALTAACSTNQPPPASAPTTSQAPAATPASNNTMPEHHETATASAKPPTTDEELVASAMAAAPESVSKDATIMTMNENGDLRTVRKGSNDWTCLPDMPTTPGVDSMCVDKNGMEWAMAWMAHTDPPKNKMGFGYMLMGGSDASNTDPFATEPPAGKPWIDTGPHVMILNIGDRFDGYPKSNDNIKQPWVMYPNTPYAHLMIPVK